MAKKKTLSTVVLIVAIIVLATALIFQYLQGGDDYSQAVSEALPQATNFEEVSNTKFIGYDSENKKVGYVTINEAMAYGGYITMATGINMDGAIEEIIIAKHKDTPTFIDIIYNSGYLEQFPGKSITDPINIEEDIDRVSGCTYSSRGIASAIALGAHSVGIEDFGYNIQYEEGEVQFGGKEISIIVLIILSLIGVKFKINNLRWVTMIGGLIFLGFIYNSLISIGNISSLFLGNYPPIKEYIFWYLLFVLIPFIVFVLKKNIYCYWMCPYGAAQEILAKIGGGKFHANRDLEKLGAKIRFSFFFIAVLLAFLSGVPGQSSYEPFAMLFGLTGVGIQWFILPLSLFTALFINRFWCRFFCPVGVAFELTIKFRRFIDKKFKNLVGKKSSKPKSVNS